jgi:hypothetical protein
MKANIHGEKAGIIHKDVQIVIMHQGQKCRGVNWGLSIKPKKNLHDFGCHDYKKGRLKLNLKEIKNMKQIGYGIIQF